MSARVDGSDILNPGLLRHQITWQQAVTGQNSTGEDIYAWTDFLTCRARVESTNGRQFESVMQRWAEADYVMTQHFSPGVLEDMRIACGGEIVYLDPINIGDPSGTRRQQTVVCRTYEGDFTA